MTEELSVAEYGEVYRRTVDLIVADERELPEERKVWQLDGFVLFQSRVYDLFLYGRRRRAEPMRGPWVRKTRSTTRRCRR